MKNLVCFGDFWKHCKGCRTFINLLQNWRRRFQVNEKLSQLDENYMVTNVPFNYYYTSEMLQKILEKPLEKKAGKNYGPPGNKKLVYFLGKCFESWAFYSSI